MAGFSKKEEQFRQFALNGSPLWVILSTCTPLALFQALQSIFKILDTLMASYIGADAVSAVAALNQVTLMITALGTGLAVGGSILISEAYGRGEEQEIKNRVSTVYLLAILVSVMLALVLIPFAEGFLRFLKTPEALIRAGIGYFRIEVLTLVIQFFNTVYIAIARSRGEAKKILIWNLIITVVKLGLSAFFVYILHGGVVMIAIATFVSQVLLLLLALQSMVKDDGVFRFSLREIRIHKSTTGAILNLSYPVSLEKILFAAGKVIVNSMSGMYGGTTVGALGISNNIGSLTTSWHMGFTDGAAPLISQNRGAGKHNRALKLYISLIALDVLIGVIGLCLVSNFLPWIAGIFARSQSNFDREFCERIIAIHRWEMIGYITLGINSATVALLLGYGYSKLTMILNAVRVFLFRVPVLWALQRFTSLGVEAVGITMMVSNVSTGVVAIGFAIPVVWHIRKMIREEKDNH